MRRFLLAAGFVLMAGTFSPAARAAGPSPTAFIAALGGQLQELSRSASRERRAAELYRLFQQDFDVAGLGRFILGRYWGMLNEPQQQEFLGLFRNYVVLTYSGRLLQFADTGSAPRVTGARSDEDGVIVSSEIVRMSGNWGASGGTARPIKVEWRLTPCDGAYRISDVVIDGFSMAANGRSTVAGVIERNGGQAQSVLAVLRQQIAAAHQ
ncbi:MAG TPA: ABC transporter substrate-binding protein [Stellaceae bacterium]|jgi:phospholipid transport system substrate-binding protein|nr:ABC transporter substrate-binding protein [Stellaceae bacterium]